MAYSISYQDRGTFVHRLDPRVKLLWWLSINVTLTTWNDPTFLLLLLVSIFAYARLAGVPIRENIRHLLPVLPFVAFVVVANVAFWRPPDPGQAHLIGNIVGENFPVLPKIPFYWETLVFSAGTLIRLLILVLSALVLIKTVSPSELALAIVKTGVPPEIGMALSMTIAYIPVVIGQLTAVMEAQQARAWKTNVSNPIARFRAYVPIAVPTFFRSFHAAEAMASAMMSRGFGYDVDNRTELKPLRFRPVDWAVAAGFVTFLVAGFLVGFFGIAKYTFTTSLLGLG